MACSRPQERGAVEGSDTVILMRLLGRAWTSSWQIYLATIAILLGVSLRLYDIDYSLQVDEIFSVKIASNPLPSLLQGVIADRVHPPLYYVILHFWIWLVGTSETAVRLLSILVSVAFLILIAKIAFQITERVVYGRSTDFPSLFIISFSAINGFLVYYGQEARPYAFAALFCALCLWLLLKIENEPTKKKTCTIFFGVTCGALMWVQYMGLLFLLPLLASLSFGPFRDNKGPLVSGTIGTLSIVPWLLVMRERLLPSEIHWNLSWMEKPTWRTSYHTVIEIFGWLDIDGSTRVLLAALILTLMPLGLSLWRRSVRPYWVVLVGSSAIFPPIAALLISLYGSVTIYTPRHLIGSVVLLGCLLGLGLTAHRAPLRHILGSFLLVWCILALPGWFRHNIWVPWQTVAKLIDEICGSCKIVVPDVPMQLGLGYYSKQLIERAESRVPPDKVPSLRWWLREPPRVPPRTDRVIVVCKPHRCRAAMQLVSAYHVVDERVVSYGRQRENPENILSIRLLEKTR